MAFDAFLKIDGIDGESFSKGHEKWIELQSFSWGVSQAGAGAPGAAGGGGGAGKVSVRDFTFMKVTDSASPALFQKCCSGEHFKKATLTCRKAGGDAAGNVDAPPGDFMTFDFFDVILSSYNEGGTIATDARPLESVSFNFEKIQMSVASPPNSDGNSGPPATGGWNFQKHRAL